MNNTSSHGGRRSVSLVRIELVDVSAGKLSCGDFLLEENVEFTVCPALGFWQSEEDPYDLEAGNLFAQSNALLDFEPEEGLTEIAPVTNQT
jgi:hypothetical protein